MNRNHVEKRLNQLPSWLWANSATLPPIYKTVWEAVREDKVRSNGMQTELLVDTNKVFPVLLTSQLPTDVLGHIWNLANQKYAGQLTEQELYIVLALVAAAQASYTFNSLDILHLLPFPPIPYLNIECLLNTQQPAAQFNSAARFQAFASETNVGLAQAEGKYVSDFKGRSKTNPYGISADMSVLVNNLPGRTTSSSETKVHSTSTAVWDVNNLPRDIKQNPCVQVHTKHVSPAADASDDFSEFQSAPIPTTPTIPMWDTKQGSAIGSRLANHNLGVKKPIEKSKKTNTNSKATHANTQNRVTSIPSNSGSQNKDQSAVDCLTDLFPKCTIRNQSKTVILKDTAIRSNDPPKNYNDNVKDFTNVQPDTSHASGDKDTSTKLEWSEKVFTPQTSETTQQDLMNLQLSEDKYSALRALVQEVSTETDSNLPNDDFGEFVSAEQPSNNVPVTSITENENFADIFTEFEFKSYTSTQNTADTNVTDLSLLPEISETFDNLKLEDTVEEKSEAGKAPLKEDTISINSIELINGTSGALTRSGSVPSLDLKSFLPSTVEEDQTTESTYQATYWEWKQYMESCVLLLQVAANIFTSITSEFVLHEVLNSAQGYNFLCNLAEVAAVCRRVNFSYKEMDVNVVGLDDLLMDIDRIWAEMEPFYANIPIVTELPTWPLHQGESIFCSLCLTVITSGRVIYNDYNYHATCANLWLNYVSNQLPVMRYPSFYSHSNICTTNSHI